MSQIGTVRRALGAVLRDAYRDFEVYDTVPGAMTTPCMVVDVASGEVRTMGRGSVTYRFDVTIVVGMGEAMDESQDLLDSVLENDPDGIFAVLQDKRDLRLYDSSGLPYADASADRFGGYSPSTVGDQNVLTASVPVTVHVRGTT